MLEFFSHDKATVLTFGSQFCITGFLRIGGFFKKKSAISWLYMNLLISNLKSRCGTDFVPAGMGLGLVCLSMTPLLMGL